MVVGLVGGCFGLAVAFLWRSDRGMGPPIWPNAPAWFITQLEFRNGIGPLRRLHQPDRVAIERKEARQIARAINRAMHDDKLSPPLFADKLRNPGFVIEC